MDNDDEKGLDLDGWWEQEEEVHHDTKEMSGEDGETGGGTKWETDQHVEIKLWAMMLHGSTASNLQMITIDIVEILRLLSSKSTS